MTASGVSGWQNLNFFFFFKQAQNCLSAAVRATERLSAPELCGMWGMEGGGEQPLLENALGKTGFRFQLGL